MESGGVWAAVGAAVVGGLTGIGALIKTFLDRPKNRADTMRVVNQAAIDTLEQIQGDAADLRNQMTAIRAERREDQRRIDELEIHEDRYVRAIRLLANYVADLHTVLEQAKPRLVPPPEPISPAELERLLSRFAQENPKNTQT